MTRPERIRRDFSLIGSSGGMAKFDESIHVLIIAGILALKIWSGFRGMMGDNYCERKSEW